MSAMNPFTPILPPGSPLARVSAQRRSRVRAWVFIVLAISIFALTGLLIQGCVHAQSGAGAVNTTATNALPLRLTTNALVPSRSPATVSNAESHAPLVAAPAVTPKSAPLLATQGAAVKNYSVVKGDNYYKIAKANDVSVSALAKANPGVDPTKLRIGQVLRLPLAIQKPTSPQPNATHATAKERP